MQTVIDLIAQHYLTAIYFTAVLAAFLLLLVQVSRNLIQLKRKQISMLKRRKVLNSVQSKSPIENPADTARKIGIENVEKRFSITRKIILPLLALPFLLLVALPFLNQLPAAFLTFFIGISTVAFGMTARPFVENIISGLVLSYSKVLNVGDTVMIEGKYGTVEDISLFHTIIKIWDWRRHVVPNIQMLQHDFVNYELTDTFNWACVEFRLSYEADLKQVEQLCIDCAQASPYCYPGKEKPKFWVMEMQEHSLKCWLVAWTKSATDAWYWKTEVQTNLLKRFQQHGIKTHHSRHELEMKSHAGVGEVSPLTK